MPCTESVKTEILKWVININEINDKVICLLYLLMEREISVSLVLEDLVLRKKEAVIIFYTKIEVAITTFIFLCNYVHLYLCICMHSCT